MKEFEEVEIDSVFIYVVFNTLFGKRERMMISRDSFVSVSLVFFTLGATILVMRRKRGALWVDLIRVLNGIIDLLDHNMIELTHTVCRRETRGTSYLT